MVERCNHTSVGILVFRQGDLLLIERRKPPYGWAPPAGHVDDGETYEGAAARELLEEVGLRAASLSLALSETYENRCRRPGGDWHRWGVYLAATGGEPVRSQEETSSMRWAGHQMLAELSDLARQHLDNRASPLEWQNNPGIEPVWLEILTALEIVHGGIRND